MSPSWQDVEAAKAAAAVENLELTARAQALPPGYFAGFYMLLENGIVTVGVGLCDVNGVFVRRYEDYILEGEAWECHKLASQTYYLYIDKEANYHIQPIAPEFNNLLFGKYHPVYLYRYVSKFTTNASAVINAVYNEGAASATDIDIDVGSDIADGVQALANAANSQATADGQLVGFFQDDEPGAGMYYGDLWIDTNGADPLDTTCIYRYQDGSGGYTAGGMSWINTPTNAIGLIYLDAATADAAANAAQGTADGAATAAATAQGAANDAQGDATTALSSLSDIAADDKITPVEKLEAKQRWDAVVVEGTATTGTIPVQATVFSVNDGDFDTAYAALDTYLNTTISVFDSMSGTTNVTRTDWDTVWKNYYDERTQLLNDIAIAAKNLADAAQIAAGNAQTAANNAQTDATTALSSLSDIAADSKVTPVEKLEAKQRWDAIVVEGTAATGTIPVQATLFGVADTDFDTAYAALDTYLNTTIDVFDDMSGTTNVTRGEWDTPWKNYYDERTQLLNVIAAKAKTLAEGAQSTADGKIVTYYQDDAPTEDLGEGDYWVDTNDDNHPHRWSGAAWVSIRDSVTINFDRIAAHAVQTGNLSVIARELINNISQTHAFNGWGGILENGTGFTSVMSLVDATVNGASTAVLRITNDGNICVRSKTFPVNHDKIYRFTCWVKKSSTDGTIFLGLSAFGEVNEGREGTSHAPGDKTIQEYDATTRAYVDEDVNKYFTPWVGFDQTTWTEYTSYIVGANRDVNDCPLVVNCDFILKLKSDTTYAAIRIINWANTASRTLDISSPSITEVGAGQIVAKNIVAETIAAREMAFSGNVYSPDDKAPNDAILIDLAQPDCIASDGTPPNSDKEIVYIAPEWEDENGVKTRNPATKLFDGGGGAASKQGAIGLFQAAANRAKDSEDLTTGNWSKTYCDTELSDFYIDGKRFTKLTTVGANLAHVLQNLTDEFAGTTLSFTMIIRKGSTTSNVTRFLAFNSTETAQIVYTADIDFDNWPNAPCTMLAGTLHGYEWKDPETLELRMIGVINATTDDIFIRIHSSGSATDGEYTYWTAVQVIDLPYPLPYTPTSRTAGILNLPIALVNKFTLIFWVRPWFTYDTDIYHTFWEWPIDATHFCSFYYDYPTARFLLGWEDGGAPRTLNSQEFDDSGTNDINQWIMVAMSIDLSDEDQTGSRLKVYTEAGSIGEDTDWGGAPNAFTGPFPLMSIGQVVGSYQADSLLTDLLYIPDTLFSEAQMDAHYTANRPWYSPTEVANKSKSVRIDKGGVRMHNSSLTITDHKNRLIDISNRTGLLVKDAAGKIIHNVADAPILKDHYYCGHLHFFDDLAGYKLYDVANFPENTWTDVTCVVTNNSNVRAGAFKLYILVGAIGASPVLNMELYLRPKGSSWSSGLNDIAPFIHINTQSGGATFTNGGLGGYAICPIGTDNKIQFYGRVTGTSVSRKVMITQIGVLI